MKKNQLFLAVTAVSLLLMGLVAFNPFRVISSVKKEAASDFYQRHPDWIWTVNNQNAVIPITGDAEYPDYYQRHPELSLPAKIESGYSAYFERHPELSALAGTSVDTSDYYLRHPELSNTFDGNIDLADYYFRHIHNRSLP